MRTEYDFIGSKELPEDALYGINTARALENFALPSSRVNKGLINSVVLIKKAAARTCLQLGIGNEKHESAIERACDAILSGKYDDAFALSAFQGGAGTSTNMCVNEIVANLALKDLGYEAGRYDIIHPLDHVNRGQSTNDVYPTALRITAITRLRKLSDECSALQISLQEKENEWADIDKLGRTQLMDAVPVTLGGEFGAYAQAIARDRWRLYKVEERLRQVNIGGGAVGLGKRDERKYRVYLLEELRRLTGFGLAAAEYPMDLTQNNDVFVEVSGLLKALAVNLMKIANDLRLMNSGPYGGLGEVHLKAVQQGSTVMAGKVNPVICEMTMQCAMRVIGNDNSITMAAAHGEFELNAFLPLIAQCLLESLELLSAAVHIFREKAIFPLKANAENCLAHLEDSAAFAARYVPLLGYDAVSEILKNSPPAEAKNKLEDALEQKRLNGSV